MKKSELEKRIVRLEKSTEQAHRIGQLERRLQNDALTLMGRIVVLEKRVTVHLNGLSRKTEEARKVDKDKEIQELRDKLRQLASESREQHA